MKYLIDVHTHTLASGHAYSTLIENVRCAEEKGLKILGITDHGVGLKSGPSLHYFTNLRVVPRTISGVYVLRGVEANIMDYNGDLDMPDEKLACLDVVIASLHDVCVKPGTREENTRALIGAMDNKYVDILGHIGNPLFEIDIDAVVEKAKEKNVLIEINNSSFGPARKGSYVNCRRAAEKAKEIGADIIAGSDAHICFDVGNFEKSISLIEEVGVPDEQVMNLHPERFIKYLKDRGKLSDMQILRGVL